MSSDIPQLDDTSHEELVESAKQRITARTDEWTDFNPHDPGVTILELLAWLADTHIYEADQLTEAHRKKYLRLLGVEPTPPQPASIYLDVSAETERRLAAGTRLRADDGHRQARFETDHPLTVTDSSVEAVVVDGEDREDRTNANATDGMYYRLFGDEPTGGEWAAVGFDGDPFVNGELRLFVDYYDDELPEPAAVDGHEKSFEPSVEVCWEYCRSYPPSEDDWEPLAVRDDTTNSLYETGFVVLEQPNSWEPTAWESDQAGCFGHPPGLVWLRCRLETGGYEIPPQCTAIETNVVAASHRCQYDEQLTPMDTGPTGAAPRRYQFDHSPVLSATVSVDGEQWTEVSDFDASGPTDRHYVLDRAAGELTVGDGQRGSQPPAEATLQASYTAGGGAVGNVSKRARWSVDAETDLLQSVEVDPKGAATGGSDAEPLADAIDRCRGELEPTKRAVTADEYGTIAESTPGLRVARSAVRLPEADNKPIEVVVVPDAPPDISRPTPSEGFKRAVDRQLDRHRLIGDRIAVRAPTYVDLTVDLRVTPESTHTPGEARRQIERRLGSFLDPIGGFDGDGWPFGRSLSETAIRETVRELPGVEYVDRVTVQAVGDATVTTDGRVVIDDTTLFALGSVDIDCGSMEADP